MLRERRPQDNYRILGYGSLINSVSFRKIVDDFLLGLKAHTLNSIGMTEKYSLRMAQNCPSESGKKIPSSLLSLTGC